ncbi:Hypothetical predicted protein [Lecanosticta acicola]|uniref:Aminoglycoside phosphotransferase domain-containing protein n=1 Tax=Lecanosticta acicola TaxID=111012 RepID=A0AAI8YZQ7_9PEZI|nr:Hypothetical predicted protein [Lecanosticta acicola]
MTGGNMTIPYYALDTPVSLPTEEEIAASPEIRPLYTGRRVVQVNTHIVAKFGINVDLAEGTNMMFVQQNTNIPVPRVYALYSKAGINYIIMQRIPGQSLQELWPQLDAVDKESVVKLLRAYFGELRALEAPCHYGSLGEKPLLDELFWTREPDAKINGPFASTSFFIDAITRRYEQEIAGDTRLRYKLDFYRQCLPRLLEGQSPVFTHGDLQGKNIMAQRLCPDAADADANASSKWRITILDWQTSGWYPSSWEYSCTVRATRWQDDWAVWIEKVLDPYYAVSAWLQDIRLELWS